MENGSNVEFSQEVIDYILENEHKDPSTMALKKSPFDNVDIKVIARQIQGRKVARKKFPFLLSYNQYRYPRKESLEQASSEITAAFKSSLLDGISFVDLTGGMGIDCYLLGRKFESCAYVEPNHNLYLQTAQNFSYLGFDHCQTIHRTCELFLEQNEKTFDWAYIDPSRRIDGKRKTSIYNYEPNLVDLQEEILKYADNLLVKLSPMQDISECISVLHRVHKVWVVSVRNEVKELLLHLKADNNSVPIISAVDLDKGGNQSFSYVFEERVCDISLGRLKKYIYQPSAAIVKAELQNRYAQHLDIEKLNPNTQLYTSDRLLENYIGKVYLVQEKIKLNKKELIKALPKMKANVITKNFPLNPQALIKKFKLKEGGENFLIAYSDLEENKAVAICNKAN